MHSPTTSPYGYSSFPKEEIWDSTDFLVNPARDSYDNVQVICEISVKNKE